MASTITVRKFVAVAPGVEIYTERRTLSTTTSPSETILFIHGFGCSINIFHPVFSPILSARPDCALLAYDWCGCGLSPYPAASRPTPTSSDFIADIDKLIELEAPDGPLHVIAHSAGTFLTIRWLTSPPIDSPHVARVKSAVLIGGPIAIPISPVEVEMQRQLADIIMTRGVHEVEEFLLQMVLGATTIKEKPLAVALLRSVLVGHSKEGCAAAIRAVAGIGDEGPFLWERFPQGLRALFLGGNEDELVPPGTLKAIAGEVQGSQTVILDFGHTPTVEDPENTAKVINEFLNGQ